jgi:hypothetical protein
MVMPNAKPEYAGTAFNRLFSVNGRGLKHAKAFEGASGDSE